MLRLIPKQAQSQADGRAYVWAFLKRHPEHLDFVLSVVNGLKTMHYDKPAGPGKA